MKLIKIYLLILFLLVINNEINSQSILQNVNHRVYNYLERISLKNSINYSKLILPKTRNEISKMLVEIFNDSDLLNSLEKRELNWFLQEYYYEINKVKLNSFNKINNLKRWNLFFYEDSIFNLKVDPILGVSLKNRFNENQILRWNGLSICGNLYYFSFQLDFRDYLEKGERIDREKNYSNEMGVHIIVRNNNSIEYSHVNGAITYGTNNFLISLGKNSFYWGSSYRSKLILSDKAPSFIYFRLDIRPVEWLNFYFLHGWLNSRIIDSQRTYSTPRLISDSTFIKRIIDKEKFLSAHIVEIKLLKNLRFSLGESIVYSDDFKIGYFIPVLFFRLVDHYYEGGDADGLRGGNSQFFADINYNLNNNCNLYSTIFIDEFSLTNFLKGNNNRTQLGYTIGKFIYGFPIDNLSFRIEYTKILPWVYSNSIPAQAYTNSNYLLGHYIGQNSDQLFTELNYKLFHNLDFKLYGEYIRHGGLIAIEYQYKDPAEPFLYGLRRNETNIGFETSYEYIHDLFAKFEYKYSFITDEDKARTPEWQLGVNHSFGLSVYYGF